MEIDSTSPQIGPWMLGSGDVVVDRVPSHVLTGHPHIIPLLAEALSLINSGGRNLIETTVEIHRGTGKSACVETGSDDEDSNIFYAMRPGRNGFTRFTRSRQPVAVTTIAVGMYWDNERRCYVLETAYAGIFAPPEPYDTDAFARRSDPEACAQQARDFWSRHALVETVPFDKTTIKSRLE